MEMEMEKKNRVRKVDVSLSIGCLMYTLQLHNEVEWNPNHDDDENT